MAGGHPAAVPQPDRDQVDFSWFTNWLSGLSSRSVALRRVGRHGEWLGAAGGLGVAVILAVWLTAGAWGPRPPSGEDTLPHLMRAEFALRNFLPRGRINGWDPTFILGYEAFLFIGPGLTWAVGVVQALSLGSLSTAGAFKVVFIGSFVALPLAVAFFGRSFGLSRRGAAVAGVLTLAVNNPFGGVGLQGLFNVGLAAHQFGAIFFFLTLGGVLRLIQAPRFRWVIASAGAGAALLVSHGISVILLCPLLAIVLVVHMTPVTSAELRRRRFEAIVRREVRAELRRLEHHAEETDGTAETGSEAAPELLAPQRPAVDFRRLATAGLLACGLASCVLLPFLAHHDLRGGFTGWGTPALGTRINQIWRGEIMFRPGVAWLVLAGLAYGAYRVYLGKPYALAMVAAPPVYLIVSHAAHHLWPGNVAAVQLPNRGLGYVGVLAMLPLASLIDRIAGRVMGAAVAVAIAVAVVVLPLGDSRSMARQQGEPVTAMSDAARQLSLIVPDGARFITERDFPREVGRTGLINPDRWLAWASARNTLNTFNVESSTAQEPAFEAEHLRDREPEVIADSLSRLGTSHVVTLSEEAASAMARSPRFEEVWSSAPVAIFGVRPKPGQPEPAALLTADVPVSAQLTRAVPEQVHIAYRTDEVSRANVAIAWSPKWHAWVDGESLPILRGHQGLIEMILPAGQHRLVLSFRPDLWDRLGLVVTLGTATGIALWMSREAYRRGSRRPEARSTRDNPAGP